MSAQNPASPWLRLAAAIYDLFPLIALWMLSAGGCLLAFHGEIDVAHPPLAFQVALRSILVAVSAAYFVISWSRGGQTIGMRAWRLRVVADDGGSLPWSRALLRIAVAMASAGVGCAWCLFDREKRGLHDIAARSRVDRLAR